MLDSVKQILKKKGGRKNKERPALNLEHNLSEIVKIRDDLFSCSAFKSLLIPD